MRAPLVALEKIPVKCSLLDHSGMARVPRRPVLLVIRVFAEGLRQAGGLAIGACGESVDDI